MRYSQPQIGPLRADLANPITKGMTFLWGGGSPLDAVGNVIGLASGGGYVTTPKGKAYYGTSGVSNGLNFGSSRLKKVITDSNYTILVWANPAASSSRSTGFANGYDGGSPWAQQNLLFNGRQGGAAAGYLELNEYDANNGGAVFILDSSSSSIIDGNYHVFVGVRNGTVGALYSDGVPLGTAPYSATANVANVTQGTTQVSGINGSDRPSTANNLLTVVWSRALSAAEVAQVSKNPWQLFKPQRSIFLASTGGGTTTGVCASTQAADISAASGGVLVAGVGLAAQALNSAASSGAVLVSGTAASTQVADASTASGAVASGSVGAGAVTQATNTATASGAVLVSGIGAGTQTANASTAAGAVTAGGTAASTQAANTATASGAVLVSGAGSVTQAANTATASGTVVSTYISGVGASIQAPDVSAGTGLILITGTGAATQTPNVSTAYDAVPVVAHTAIPGGGHPNKRRQKLSSTQALIYPDDDDYQPIVTYHEDDEILAVVHAFLTRMH